MERLVYSMQPPARRRDLQKPMQVLCLGLSRSGTDSLRNALTILGYDNVYHGFVITSSQREDCAFWVPLMRQKYARQKETLPPGIDFDSVLAECEAVTDGPANVFGEELMAYYPDARVVLNRRKDVDAWYASMRRTCLQVFGWPMWVMSWFDTELCWLWWNFWEVMLGYYCGDFERYGKQVAVEHYEKLERSLAQQKRDYLEWTVEDGWEPLCRFLGKPVPGMPFPDGNKGSGQFQDNMQEATRDMVTNAIRNLGITVVGLTAVGVGVYYRLSS
ncbi:acyl coA binding protein domain-containing protein [Purpureocillium lavendulum]|uniref:Acyl coA binding protein domain-containing protein n=1 Tax=Purpureocillium lavendulum TaxID=1247861 RepID=A0AB34FZP8_9HYPO|nr:acyl coA binding protein domain-containing protein [Purpureocillium lavendulum]